MSVFEQGGEGNIPDRKQGPKWSEVKANESKPFALPSDSWIEAQFTGALADRLPIPEDRLEFIDYPKDRLNRNVDDWLLLIKKTSPNNTDRYEFLPNAADTIGLEASLAMFGPSDDPRRQAAIDRFKALLNGLFTEEPGIVDGLFDVSQLPVGKEVTLRELSERETIIPEEKWKNAWKDQQS